MQELDDNALLREYVERGSEEAFATLVARHVNKVYSVALRQTRNPLHAEEITQAVFVILAQKARQLDRRVILSGWLYHTARLTSVTFIRGEVRRARREQEAHMQNISQEDDSALWQQLSPLLDSAMGELNDADRDAVALRFFDGKSMKEIGVAMGTSEDASKKRVNRALDKLLKLFRRRGVDSTAASLERTISTHSIEAAPVALAKAAVAAAVAKGATGGSAFMLAQTAMKAMAWAKMKMAIAVSAGALLAIGGGSAAYEIHRHLQRADDGGNGAMTIPTGPANLTLKWVIGERYPMHVELVQNTETPMPNAPAPVKMQVNFTENFDITPQEKLAAGGWKLEVEFRKVTVAIQQGGRTLLSQDSGAGDAASGNLAAGIVGGKVECYIDGEGNVTNVEGVEELLQRTGADAKSQELAIFRQLFNDGSIKQYLAIGSSVPGRFVKVGETWPFKKDVSSAAGLLTVDGKSQFKNWEQHNGHMCAHLKTTGNISTKSATAATGMAMNIEKAKVLGDAWFDPAAGRVVELDSDQNLALKITTQAQSFVTTVQQSVRVLWLEEQ